MSRVCVIGSLNVDLTITIPRFHMPGETIQGSGFYVNTGGKGGNQAVALGRLGADVSMAGKLGGDENGRLYRDTLKRERVCDNFVTCCDKATGVALIEVNENTGDNRIAIYPGANGELDTTYIDSIWSELSEFDIFLMQFEIPMETVLYVAKKIHSLSKILILDPAPAKPIPNELLGYVTYLTPNETELSVLTGIETGCIEQIQAASMRLQSFGTKNIIAKMGAAGAMLISPDNITHVPGFSVNAVDTTAAGDSFNAGLAYALCEGKSPIDAISFANAVGALSTTSMGAQSAMPTLSKTLSLINSKS